MEQLIELYLYKNKKCPLPQVGTLHLSTSNAVAWYADKRMEAPLPVIKLAETVLPADDFISFIAARKNISITEANILLDDYCSSLKKLNANSESLLHNTGRFFVNPEGVLVFKANELPGEFLPSVNAERVLHQEVSHNMVVGDKETNSVEMAAFFADAANGRTDKWWIYAIVLAIAGLSVIAYHLKENDFKLDMFGNTGKIVQPPTTNTYRLSE